MRRLIAVAIFICLVAMVGFAQETPKPEVFGGYQFTHLDPSWNASGWNGAATMYINHWFGVTGDFSGAYKSGGSFHTYTFGPTVSTHKGNFSPFVHGLFGGAHASQSGFSDSGLAMMFGGGVDAGNKKFAFRMFQADWEITRFNGISDKSNIRISTGALLRF